MRIVAKIIVFLIAIVLSIALLRIIVGGVLFLPVQGGQLEHDVISNLVVDYSLNEDVTAEYTMLEIALLERDVIAPACNIFIGVAIVTVAVRESMNLTESPSLVWYANNVIANLYATARRECRLAL